MRKIIIVAGLFIAAIFGYAMADAAIPRANADYFAYPCNYPFQGMGASVSIVVTAGGQFCDGPTEVNWSHYHCESGGGHVGTGGFGFAPLQTALGVGSLGAIGGGGIGGDLEGCHFLCPDGSLAPFPNPPAAWVKKLVLKPEDNECQAHMTPRGNTDAPLPQQLPPGSIGYVPTPAADNPPPLAFEPGTPPPGGQPPIPQPPSGQPSVTLPDEPGALTPGSPIPLP